MTTSTKIPTQLAFALRPMTEADLPAFVEAANEWAALEDVVDSISLGEMTDWFHSPMNRETQTLAFALNEVGTEGQLIGSGGFDYHPEDGKAWGWMHVHPDYRLRGVGRALYANYERQFQEAGAKEMLCGANQHATLLIEFLKRRGYEIERYFWDMRLEADHPLEAAVLPQGFTVRTFVPDQDEALLTHVRNATFAEHYGSVQRTVEEITYRTKQPDFHTDGVFFAFDGDEIAGFCYTGRDEREWERLGEKVGHIHTLGVMPAYRGRGLGRALLLVGVNYLRQFVDPVELGVEGKNDSALALYRSVGFHEHRGWANMVRG